MRSKLIVLALLFPILISCGILGSREDVDIKQQGIIYNAINKSPIINVKVQLWKRTGGSSFFGTSPLVETLEQEVYTDQAGHYFIDYAGTGNCINYRIKCYAEGYISLDHGEVCCTGQLKTIDFCKCQGLFPLVW